MSRAQWTQRCAVRRLRIACAHDDWPVLISESHGVLYAREHGVYKRVLRAVAKDVLTRVARRHGVLTVECDGDESDGDESDGDESDDDSGDEVPKAWRVMLKKYVLDNAYVSPLPRLRDDASSDLGYDSNAWPRTITDAMLYAFVTLPKNPNPSPFFALDRPFDYPLQMPNHPKFDNVSWSSLVWTVRRAPNLQRRYNVAREGCALPAIVFELSAQTHCLSVMDAFALASTASAVFRAIMPLYAAWTLRLRVGAPCAERTPLILDTMRGLFARNIVCMRVQSEDSAFAVWLRALPHSKNFSELSAFDNFARHGLLRVNHFAMVIERKTRYAYWFVRFKCPARLRACMRLIASECSADLRANSTFDSDNLYVCVHTPETIPYELYDEGVWTLSHPEGHVPPLAARVRADDRDASWWIYVRARA